MKGDAKKFCQDPCTNTICVLAAQNNKIIIISDILVGTPSHPGQAKPHGDPL
jgi:hypothetical protein